MKVIPPYELDYTNITSDAPSGSDPAEWSIATAYVIEDRVKVTVSNINKIYECLVNVTGGDSPEISVTRIVPKWVEIGPTNKWAMYDLLTDTKTYATNTLTNNIIMTPGPADSLAIVGMDNVSYVHIVGYGNNDNLLVFPEDQTNVVWVKSNLTIGSNTGSTIDPNGTNLADKLEETNTAVVVHSVKQQFNTIIGATYTFSVFLKPADRNFARISLENEDNSGTAYIEVDLTSGIQSIHTSSGTLTLAGYGMSTISNGWKRYWITVPAYSAWPVSNKYLLQGNGSIIDGSGYNLSITKSANVSINTSLQKFGSGCIELSQSYPCYVNCDTLTNIGSSDYRVDFWLQVNAAGNLTYRTICNISYGFTSGWAFSLTADNNLEWGDDEGYYNSADHDNAKIGVGSGWVYITMTKIDTTFTFYLNAVVKFTSYTANALPITKICIGDNFAGTHPNFYIDDFNVEVGTAYVSEAVVVPAVERVGVYDAILDWVPVPLKACVYPMQAITGTNPPYTGTTGNGIYVWGTKAEKTNIPTMYAPSLGVQVYEYTANLSKRPLVFSWYNYFFSNFSTKPSVVLFDLPSQYDSLSLQVETTGSGTIGVGTLAIGLSKYIGSVQLGASIDTLNFSTIDRDLYGNATLIPRRSVPKTNQRLYIDKSILLDVISTKINLDARSAIWVGLAEDNNNPYFNSLLVVGFYRTFTFELDNPIGVFANLELEGI